MGQSSRRYNIRQRTYSNSHINVVYYVSMSAKQTVVSRSERGEAPKTESLGLVIDNASFVPYYEQIVDQVRTLIKGGEIHEGEVFCSEGEVARTLGISKMPVRQAFQKLRSEGLLIMAKGKRPIVGSGRVHGTSSSCAASAKKCGGAGWSRQRRSWLLR